MTVQSVVSALAALCSVFGASALSKVASLKRRRAFTASVRALRLLPVPLVVPVAAAVSWAELALAAGLAAAILGVVTSASWAFSVALLGLLCAVGLLGVLTAGIVLALRGHNTAPCACFGASDRRLSWRHVLRNSVMQLVGVSGAGLAATASPATVVDPVGAALACAAGAVLAVVLIRLDEVVELFAPTGPTRRAQVGG